MANGDLHLLGTLYVRNSRRNLPGNSLNLSDVYSNGVSGIGPNIEIRDTDPNSAYQIQWREVTYGGKKLLISSRPIVRDVLQSHLRKEGLITGKTVVIDGEQYILRVLTGGGNNRNGTKTISPNGGELPNEWDAIIGNEANISGLPNPGGNKGDAHDNIWGWGVGSTASIAEAGRDIGNYLPLRGGTSPKHWLEGPSGTTLGVSYRPVLELLNSPPTVTTIPNQSSSIGVNKTMTLSTYFSDPDGDTLTYTVSSSATAVATATVSGSTLTLVPKVIGSSTITVTANDGKGGTVSKAFTFTVANTAPTVTLSTTNNRTLYENDTFGISGTATDANSGDVVMVNYQINGGAFRTIAIQVSTGAAIAYNRVLTFKSGMLYDGATAITAVLAEGSQHVLKVWAEDNKGGKSSEQTRTFYVVPNRPASLTIDPFPSATDLINTDAITISGNVSDPDNNTVTVKYKIANGSYTEVYSGSGGSFSFQLSLAALSVGANTVTIQATDEYGAITSKTLQITKAENVQPLKTAVTRYKLTPPNGTAKGVLLWIEREVGDLVVDAEISMGANGEAENFLPMTKSATAFVTEGIEEDEFTFEADSAKENIVLKLTMERSSTASDKGITLISGVLS